MLQRALKTVRYAAQLWKLGGPRVFFPRLTRQIYSRDTLYGLEKTLSANGRRIESRLPYILNKASEKDIDELLSLVKTESRQAAHELLERKWFYENGFHDCYLARTADTGEPCGIAWLVSAEDDVVARGFGSRLPALKNGEVLLENCYTFEKYRGQGIMPSLVHELQEMALTRGFKRLFTYVRRDNAASIRVFEKLDFRQFEEVPELKLLFQTKRKHV